MEIFRLSFHCSQRAVLLAFASTKLSCSPCSRLPQPKRMSYKSQRIGMCVCEKGLCGNENQCAANSEKCENVKGAFFSSIFCAELSATKRKSSFCFWHLFFASLFYDPHHFLSIICRIIICRSCRTTAFDDKSTLSFCVPLKTTTTNL